MKTVKRAIEMRPVFLVGISLVLASCAKVSTAPPVVPTYQVPSDSVLEKSASVGSVKAQQRSGLATDQGRAIHSTIREVDFQRIHKDKPSGTGLIYYNNEEGIKEMVSSELLHRAPSLSKDASGYISWGVKGSWNGVKTYESDGKRFAIGKKGKEYFLEVLNKHSRRIEIVVSVDGLDILSGEPASYKKRGYIVEPYSKMTIRGYRTGDDTVHAFKFSNVAQSYTNQLHGNTRNVGVIGIAVFASDQQNASGRKWSPKVDNERLTATPFQ